MKQSKRCHQCHVHLAEDHVGPMYCSARCAERRRAGNRKRLARWKLEHPGKAAEHNRVYRKRHADRLREKAEVMRKENRAKLRAASRRHYWKDISASRRRNSLKQHALYIANPEQARQKARRWREANPDKVKAMARAWAIANRDRKTRNENNRRALKKNADGSYSFDEWKSVCASQGGTCFYCGSREKLTADHVVALSRGGSNFASDIVGACGSCNSSKKNVPVAEWIERRLSDGRPVALAALALLANLR